MQCWSLSSFSKYSRLMVFVLLIIMKIYVQLFSHERSLSEWKFSVDIKFLSSQQQTWYFSNFQNSLNNVLIVEQKTAICQSTYGFSLYSSFRRFYINFQVYTWEHELFKGADVRTLNPDAMPILLSLYINMNYLRGQDVRTF